MAELEGRYKAFVNLGGFLRGYVGKNSVDTAWKERFDRTIEIAQQHNGWFTRNNIVQSLAAWGENLREADLSKWLKPYQLKGTTDLTVAVVMAGNIPLVGFHDFLSVLLSGNRVKVKLSSNDRHLLPLISEYLTEQEPGLDTVITFVDGKLKDFDAVIATGSNNSARYFEYYFGKKPNIIRKNRNSVAVLNGTESKDELEALGRDIFDYFGLGCRSVSKLYVPEGYQWEAFYPALESYSTVMDHQKYANNYDYNKAVYLMSDIQIYDNGFLLLKEDAGYASPIGTVFYETYSEESALLERLQEDSELIQCVVGPSDLEGTLPYGTSQQPALWDYADGVDTLSFLSQLKTKKHKDTHEKT